MSRQLQSQQQIGFSIGASTAPDYIIKSRTYSNELSNLYDMVEATYGSRDNLYDNNLVGYESLPLSITLPLDNKICPILIASAMGTTTSTGTSPFINTSVPRNVDGSSNLTVEGVELTFFFYDSAVGLKKHTGKLANTITITPENNQFNMEIELLGGKEEILTGADLTTAEAGFSISPTTYGTLYRPGDITVEFDDDTTFASSTIVKADFGFSFNFTNNVQEIVKSNSAIGELVQPTPHLGRFSAGFEFTADVEDDSLYTRYLNSTPTAFRFLIQRGTDTDNQISFDYAPTPIQNVIGEKVGNSDDPVKQTITLEKAVNGITEPSLSVEIKNATDLASLF